MSSKVRYSDRKFYFECFDYVSKDTWVEIKPGRNTDDSSRVSAFPEFSAATKSCSYNYSKAIFLIVVLIPLCLLRSKRQRCVFRDETPRLSSSVALVTCVLSH